jgi:hypothetical protein
LRISTSISPDCRAVKRVSASSGVNPVVDAAVQRAPVAHLLEQAAVTAAVALAGLTAAVAGSPVARAVVVIAARRGGEPRERCEDAVR